MEVLQKLSVWHVPLWLSLKCFDYAFSDAGILSAPSTIVQLTKALSLAGAWHVPDGGHAQAPGAAELALLPCGRRQDGAGARLMRRSKLYITGSLAA